MEKEILNKYLEEKYKQAEELRDTKQFIPAIALYYEAAAMAASEAWQEKELEAHYFAGLVRQESNDLNSAIEDFQSALELALQLGEPGNIRTLYITLGFAYAGVEANEEAIKYLAASANNLEGLDFETAYSTLNTLGVLLSNENKSLEAVQYYQKALVLARTQPDELVAIADTLANLGIAYEKADKLSEAIDSIEEYRKILFEAGDIKVKEAALLLKRLKHKAGYKD
ncbi:tetratricopeptide repeat protein [Candidatus Chlorohelix sp.]|uniref:tetratricopeptide repeat protein n=1 Tax=Candidatus Chlorohelix sp. TaxID=3139201 RepID=UPI0030368D00